jgi:ketosteroid isomerase-like protein
VNSCPVARGFLLGAAGAILARAGLRRAMLVKLRRDLAALNAGHYQPLLASFADDAVLVFSDGTHRWAGQHDGRASIEAFLQDFVAAGLQGDFRDLLIGGPPWKMRAAIRFDDHAEDPSGTRVYGNRTVLYVTFRWGKVVRQEDFFADTSRIEAFEQHLKRTEGHG